MNSKGFSFNTIQRQATGFLTLSRLSLALLASGAVLLGGCSSEEPNISPVNRNEDSGLWLSFAIRTDNKSDGMKAPQSRADDDPNAKDGDAKINSLCIYITDKDGNFVAAGLTTDPDRIITEQGVTTATVSLWPATKIDRTQDNTYKLHVVANTPDLYGKILVYALEGKQDNSTAPLLYSYNVDGYSAALSDLSAAIPSDGMPMANLETAAALITIDKLKDDKSNKYDTPETAFGKDKPASDRISVEITRLLGRIDFKCKEVAEGETTLTNANTYKMEANRYAIEVVALSPVNMASSVYLKQRTEEVGSEAHILAPTQTLAGALGSNVAAPTVGKRWKITEASLTDYDVVEYPAEYFANVSDWSKLKVSQTPGIIITGLLRATDETPEKIKKVLNNQYIAEGASEISHPDLYYFDDKTYQGEPQLNLPTGATAGNWHTLKYDAALGGYPVYYLKSIRHKSDADTGSVGTVVRNEYGIARNTIYQLSIDKIIMLPHPWTGDDSPESSDDIISLTVKIPTSWTYHRRVFDIEQ